MSGVSPDEPRSPGSEFRPELEGLRAVAVGLVLLYHASVPKFEGGYVGVDVFFVLSGFLITTLLLGEFGLTNGIDLVRFWLRRARRLLPALFVLIGVGAIYASTTSPFDKGPLRWDLLSSIFYVANWRFIASGQSYFAEYAAASPVRHLWSLAIEEQFYVIWPIVVLVALGLMRRVRSRAAGRVAFWMLLVTGAASAVLMALSWDESDPSLAYFSTLTRAHELLIGAAGAAILLYCPVWRDRLRRRAGIVAGVGLAFVMGAGIAMSDTDRFYYVGGSVLFSLASIALVTALVAGHASKGIAIRALQIRPLVWLGAVSYGVYLWHWPITIALTPESTGLDGPTLLLGRLCATLIIAAASFYIVEQPIRRGHLGRVRLEPRIAFSGAAAIAVVLAGLTVLSTRGAQPLPAYVSNNLEILTSTVPSARGSVALVGDSLAMSLYPGLVHEAGSRGWNVASATFPGCSIGDTLRADSRGKLFWNTKSCASSTVAKQSELVAAYHPSIVFWHSGRDRYDIRVGDRLLVAGSDEWRIAVYADWDRTLDRLTASGAMVALILPLFAEGAIPSGCRSLASAADRACRSPYLSNASLGALYADWAARHPDRITVVDLTSELCSGGTCAATLDHVRLRSDKLHFTTEGSLVVARLLLAAVPADLRP